MAEQIKKYPLAKVESLFHMRMENGQMTFVDESIDPRFYGRVVLLAEEGFIRIEEDIPMEKIVQVRQDAKRKVFVTNAFRALQKVAPDHDLKNISNVVLVGGSAEDFEIPAIIVLYAAGETFEDRKAPEMLWQPDLCFHMQERYNDY
jgi:diol dehydratase reactivase alpha subunit